ncbi:MAG: hypothetical protein HUK22_02160, partial [Thermoguttaceae bacterium]|nr:hypothetical protein [Thermoguttaceae bacterium]
APDAWNSDVDARWRRAHSASERGIAALGESVARPLWRENDASPFFLLVPFLAGLAFYDAKRGRDPLPIVLAAAIFAFWIVWHLATHRLTRFLVPIYPLVAALVGVYAARFLALSDDDDSRPTSENVAATSLALICAAFALCFCGLSIDLLAPGRLAPLKSLERDPARFPAVALYFNDNRESNDNDALKILLVGEAKAFAYRVPVAYSTCWNHSPLMKIIDGGVEFGADVRIVDPDAIKANFKATGIGRVVVDYVELARFRSPGNYGFSDPEIDEALFQAMERVGVLKRIALPAPYLTPETTVVYRVED